MAESKANRVLARTLARALESRETEFASGGEAGPGSRCLYPYCETPVDGGFICDPPVDA